MVCAPEMLGRYYRSTNALMPLAADATRLLTARFPACVAGKRRGSIFRGSAISCANRLELDITAQNGEVLLIGHATSVSMTLVIDVTRRTCKV